MAEDHVGRHALRWLQRLYGLPTPLQKITLAGLALWKPAIAARARKLLALDGRSHSILDQPIPLAAMPAPPTGQPHESAAEDAGRRMGQRFGAWRIKSIVGSGGMGTVYLASRDDGTYERDVALKFIHGGLLTPEARTAFQKERNALAALNHRDIVPILDSGLDEDGTPWFVMPLVEGTRIDQWCDDRRLDIRSRVGIAVSLCDALAYAHRRGVLHQDIKASAVLVTADAQPKLLDFGLAEIAHGLAGAATDGAGRHLAFSAGYAAPELMHGSGPSVAIDIHALGVLLYHLLCGQGPSSPSPLHIPLTAVMQKDAKLPSQLALDLTPSQCRQRQCRNASSLHRILKGDLDRITSKCVAVNPEERYACMDALREDLQRWSEMRPISLRNETGYRVQRFLQRNSSHVAVAAILLAIALGSGIVALWQQAQATREVELSSRVDQIFSQSLGAAALSRAGELPLNSTQLLDHTEANLRQYAAKDPPNVLARGLSILARSQTDAGSYEKAEALAFESRTTGDNTKLQFAFNQVTLARLHNLRARHALAEQAARAGLGELRFALSRQDRLAAIQLQTQLAIAQSGEGERQKAMSSIETAIRQAIDLDSPPGDLALAHMLILRGSWYRQRLMLEASEQDLMRAIELARGIEPRVVDDARESLMRTIRASRKPGREGRALGMAEELLQSRKKTLGDRHPQTGVAWGELAFMQMLNQNNAGAEESVKQANDIISSSLGTQHPAYARVLVARSHLLTFAGKFEEAIPLTQQAFDILVQHHGKAHELSLEAQFLLASQYWWLSRKDPRALEKAIAIAKATIDTYSRKYGEVAAIHRMALAAMLSGAGRPQEASREIKQARLDALHQYGPNSQEMLHIRLTECTFMAASNNGEDRLDGEFDSLIGDASRVDSLYARSILWSAYLEKAKWKLQAGDVLNARESYLKARALAVKVGNPTWVAGVDREIAKMEEADAARR